MFVLVHDETSGLGFMGNMRRICASSTRHSDFFIVVGDLKATQNVRQTPSSEDFRAWVKWFDDRGRVVRSI